MTSLQIFYLAFGYRYLMMAINSARTARQAGTLCQIKLITNLPLKAVTIDDEAPFDEIVVLNSANKENRYTKVSMLEFSDGPANLYLDCDTEVKYPLHKFAPLLSNFDVALRTQCFTTKWEFHVDGSTPIGMGLSELNGGVMFFANTPGARELFSLWGHYFAEMRLNRDQPSLLKAFLKSKTTRLFPLGVGWNAIPVAKRDLHFMRRLPEETRIVHYLDPVLWPSAGLNLAYVHRQASLQFSERGVQLEREIERFDAVARHYTRPLFRYGLGRRFLNWQLEEAAKRNGAGPARLRMKGELEVPGGQPLKLD